MVSDSVSAHRDGSECALDRVEQGSARERVERLTPEQRDLVRRIKTAAQLARKLGLNNL